jgi:2-oxoglutarate dehydrogenase E2 component (dihydrolipoamide succinyltransferase)
MAIEIKIPAPGESVKEVTLAKWVKEDKALVKMDEVVCEMESDKASFELHAAADGVLCHKAKTGSVLPVGYVVAVIEPAGGDEVMAAETKKSHRAPPAASSDDKEKPVAGHPSPAAAKLMAEAKLDAADITGTGKDGRITKGDVLATQSKQTPAQPPAAVGTAGSPQSLPQTLSLAGKTGERGVMREKMSTLRKTIAKKLVTAKNETAMLTTFNEIDMSAVVAVRKKYKEMFKEKYGVGLGYMSFFARAAIMAMQEFPVVNARIDGEEIVHHHYVDLGIAVSTSRGLIVPIIVNAEAMTLAELEKEVERLAGRARDNKVTVDEITGGTFTITNGGVFGSMLSTPIINYPQVAILGMHNILERPVAVDGDVMIRPIMYVALSYDHRVIDGRDSVSFLVKVKQLLEDPIRLLLAV